MAKWLYHPDNKKSMLQIIRKACRRLGLKVKDFKKALKARNANLIKLLFKLRQQFGNKNLLKTKKKLFLAKIFFNTRYLKTSSDVYIKSSSSESSESSDEPLSSDSGPDVNCPIPSRQLDPSTSRQPDWPIPSTSRQPDWVYPIPEPGSRFSNIEERFPTCRHDSDNAQTIVVERQPRT